MENLALFEFKDVSFSYMDRVEVLRGCNLIIRGGQVTTIIGPNGSGKTTLILHLNGILKPNSGEIYFKGKRLTYEKHSLRILRSQVGIVFQNPDTQLFCTSVMEDVSFGVLNLGLSRSEVEKRVIYALERVNMLDHIDRPVHMLSFGQKKRVAIAGVLAMKPDVFVFDEPFAGLDYFMIEELIKLIFELKNEGHSIIIATHDIDLSCKIMDQVIFLKNGKVIYQNSWQNLSNKDWIEFFGKIPTIAQFLEILTKKNIIKTNINVRTIEDIEKLLMD